MKTKIYAIFDNAVKAFLQPHFSRTHGEAERNFRMAVNDEKSGHLFASPENFTLFHIGEYDEDTGVITPNGAPMNIITGTQVKKSLNDDQRQVKMAI